MHSFLIDIQDKVESVMENLYEKELLEGLDDKDKWRKGNQYVLLSTLVTK